MADSDTLWLQAKLQRTAQTQAELAIEQTGRALPCQVTAVNGSLVTVSFQVNSGYTLPALTIPRAESQWLRSPVQVDDYGLVIPSDTFLGGVSGGSGVANLNKAYGNLGSLVWVPVASTAFAAVPRANAAYVDANPTTGIVTIVAGGKTFTFSSAGFTASDGITFEEHLHSGVTGGSSDTGPPVA